MELLAVPIAIVTVIVGILTIILHIALAIAVYQSASVVETDRNRGLPISPGIWALATLTGGLITVLIYWVVYHSRLSKR